MAISLSNLKTVKAADLPPRMLVYGQEKIGKTSLAAEFPDPIFLRIESGPPEGIELTGWDIASYADLMEAFGVLYNDDHDFKTIVIDSTSSLESRVVWPEVCRRGNERGEPAANIEDFGFGKGYKNALPIWEEILGGLNDLRGDKGMSIMLLGHSVVKNFGDPETQSYSTYDVALQDAEKVSAAARIKREMDAILFIKKDVSAEKEDPKNKHNNRVLGKGGSTRWIHTEGRPAFVAGNRYAMPEKILYKKGEGFTALAPHISALSRYLGPAQKAA